MFTNDCPDEINETNMRVNKLCAILLFTAALLRYNPSASAEGFEVDGVVEYKYQEEEVTKVQLNAKFHLFYSEGKAKIRSEVTEQSEEFEYFLYSYDETNSYMFTKYVLKPRERYYDTQKEKFIQLNGQPQPKSSNEATLTVNPWSVPDVDLGLISPIWVVYCLKLPGNQNTYETNHFPVYPMKSRWLMKKKDFKIQAQFGESMRFPDRIEQIYSLDNGMMSKIVGITRKWTRAAGESFPLVFDFKIYVNANDNIESGWALQKQYIVTATNINTIEKIERFTPEIQVPTRIIDRRFSRDRESVEELVYTKQANEVIHSRDEIANTRMYQAEKRNNATGRETGDLSGVIVSLVVGALLLLGVICVWKSPNK